MSPQTPVIFIHGLWIHAGAWQDWTELFAGAGYAPIAPGWPGEASAAVLPVARRIPGAAPTGEQAPGGFLDP
jgi:non-heme chloroperoxidase